MELKLSAYTRDCIVNSFKSHLYGIEIVRYDVDISFNFGLNRTFMELKCRNAHEEL